MRLQLTVTYRRSSSTGPQSPSIEDVEVEAPDGSTAAELVDALVTHLALAGASTDRTAMRKGLSLVVRGGAVDPQSRVGFPPLVNGAAVNLMSRNPLRDRAAGRHETLQVRSTGRAVVVLAVTHGPDAGHSLDLHAGRHVIGRSGEVDLPIDDPSLSRRHAEIWVDGDGVTLRDLGSTNGTRVDGEPVTGAPVPITAASTIRLGDSVVALRHPGTVPAASRAMGDGTVAVNRRPRVPVPHPPASVAMPNPPSPPRRTRVPWVAVLLPIPVAAVLAVVVGPTMLAFALMGPVLMLGTALSDRWGSRRTYAAELAAHDAQLVIARERVRTACRDELRALVRSAPDAATVLGIAAGPGERLWERRRQDADALLVTIGRCRHDASVQLVDHSGGGATSRPQLDGAPCTVSLTQVGVLGLAGEVRAVADTVRWLVGQLVALHSPSDLRVVALLRDDDAFERWAWLGRIPHCRNDPRKDGSAPVVTLAREGADSVATVAALAATIRERLSTQGAQPWQGPVTLVLLDGAAAFRSVPGLATVLTDGPRVGVVCIASDRERSALPHEAGAVLDLPLDGAPDLALPGHEHEALVVDGVGSSWSERLSRCLAPLRDAAPSTGASALPTSVRLSGCLSPRGDSQDGGTGRTLAAAALAAAWQQSPHSTVVPLGMCGTGTFSVDLAADGPHVLVGGTTGAGKSELLRTLVASLALHNTPQHLSFVLVDYKGGSAFKDCEGLPHVAGVVTDLDDLLAARALTSLTAEVTRRERLLLGAGAGDFPAYQRTPAGQASPLARLVVVVDEFRALAEELPAFVDGLVHVASLGRSLGIHLVLATQRPAGVVTADIKANLNLRIALRMRDRIDSEDVVDSPAAAGVDPGTPGRAHARTGGESLVEFQAAHVGAARHDAPPSSIRVRSWNPSTPQAWRRGDDQVGPSELVEVVATIREATTIAGLEPAPAAWLPPLPSRVSHSSLTEPTDRATLHLGLVDVPEGQRQEPLVLDLHGRGHWAVVGSPGTGRSTTLRTIAELACAANGPDLVHIYAVSGGSLAALASLPHVGACVDWNDTARVERLVTRLSDEVAARRGELSRRGCTTFAQRWGGEPTGGAPPPMLLLLDDWDLVANRHDDLALATVVDRLLALLREGESVGLIAVLAGDRSLLLGRAGAAVTQRLVLRLADPTDAVLLGLAPRQVAALRNPGQGLTSDGHLVQLAVRGTTAVPGTHALPAACTLPSDHADDCPTPRAVPAPPSGRYLPLRVDAVPTTVAEADLLPHTLGPHTLALGIGGDDSAVLGLDPGRDGRRWLVAGAPGSGVSTTLTLVARALVAAGRPVAVVAGRHGPLDALRGCPDLVTWCDGVDPTPLVEARRAAPSLSVVVDSADELLDHPVEAVLREVARLVDPDGGLLVVGAGSTALASMFRGLAFEVARHRTGVLLGPTSAAESRALGVRVPVERTPHPGRGHLVRRGTAIPLQVALPAVSPPRSPPDRDRDSVSA